MRAEDLLSQAVPANEKYLTTVKGLVNKFLRTKPNEVNLLAFAHFCVDEVRPSVSSSSWLSYRYQIDQCFKREELRQVLNVGGANPKRSNYQPAFSRAKQIQPEKLAIIEQYCRSSSSKYATPLRLCLRATILTGLRPNEWATCELEYVNGQNVLSISNTVKADSDSKVIVRRIPLTHLNQEQMSELVDWLVFCESEDFDGLIAGVKGFLKQICQREFAHDKKRIQLYSARHQFAANLKATGLEKSLIARLLGHSSEEMQTQHYGRKVHGQALPFDSALAEVLNPV